MADKKLENESTQPESATSRSSEIGADGTPLHQRLANLGGTLTGADLIDSEKARAALLGMPLEQVSAMVQGSPPSTLAGTPRRRQGTSIMHDPAFKALAIDHAVAIAAGRHGGEEFEKLAAHVDLRAARLPQVTQRSRIIEATSALLRVNIEDDAEREVLLVQVREIVAALDAAPATGQMDESSSTAAAASATGSNA